MQVTGAAENQRENKRCARGYFDPERCSSLNRPVISADTSAPPTKPITAPIETSGYSSEPNSTCMISGVPTENAIQRMRKTTIRMGAHPRNTQRREIAGTSLQAQESLSWPDTKRTSTRHNDHRVRVRSWPPAGCCRVGHAPKSNASDERAFPWIVRPLELLRRSRF